MTNTFHPHQLTKNVKLLHKVAIVCNQQALVLKRSERSFSRPGKWDLPGGNSDWPKELHQPTLNLHQHDIVREVFEETAIKLTINDFTENNLVYFATFFEPNKQLYSINCGWTVKLSGSQLPLVKISSEHTQFHWLTATQLADYDFGGSDRDYETKILRHALINQ